ncbi:class I SAM-dependent methyltransferase [Leptolyngbya sp. KIOST-1]|uniref:class I SAM-dependent methyltransferase n=1 Tax=Leptolyngbya sp. KIOST-1 TaxID=1229172 RepID=UPI000907CB17|nr:class I SAM-dependent methyltransferase [Leptolyngbya sp. KIOST-1]
MAFKYNSGQLIYFRESHGRKFFRRTQDYLSGVTVARQSINESLIDFVREIDGNIVEIGGSQNLEEYMKSGKYVLLDLINTESNDVTANAEKLPFASNSMSGFVCISVLEHTPNPQKVINEIWRCLRPGGKAFISVPWMFEAHMEPYDFFRFSPFLMKKWLSDFDLVDIQLVNGYLGLLAHYLQKKPLTRFTIGLWSFWLDQLAPNKAAWTTQINIWVSKEKDLLNEASDDDSGDWIQHLRCPSCVILKGGELFEKGSCKICKDCGSRYPVINHKKIVFATGDLNNHDQ